MTSNYRIERARAADLRRLAEIERAAASLFEPGQIPDSLRDDVTSLEDFHEAHERGLLWVARSGDEPVGFAVVELLACGPHLEEIDVHPAHGRRGIGRALLGAVTDWARAAGHPRITLTTFRDIPWNAPFYASLGFRVIPPAELTPELDAIVRDEAARGLDPARRVVMGRKLDAAPGRKGE
jgi:GNAT superfamily N-acetyltransferase